jgi:hypothetical protein
MNAVPRSRRGGNRLIRSEKRRSGYRQLNGTTTAGVRNMLPNDPAVAHPKGHLHG